MGREDTRWGFPTESPRVGPPSPPPHGSTAGKASQPRVLVSVHRPFGFTRKPPLCVDQLQVRCPNRESSCQSTVPSVSPTPLHILDCKSIAMLNNLSKLLVACWVESDDCDPVREASTRRIQREHHAASSKIGRPSASHWSTGNLAMPGNFPSRPSIK